MSSNTTFTSQGNFNRPSITKLKLPAKDIVNIIILGSTFILLLKSPFIDLFPIFRKTLKI